MCPSPSTMTPAASTSSDGTYVIGKDPRFDPFCVWGNEILMNQHQVRKLIKIVSKMGQNMAIKLFVYTLSKTTANCMMWFPKQFTPDYLSKYMIGGHAKVKVFLPDHDDYLDVLMKIVKDGRSAITRGLD